MSRMYDQNGLPKSYHLESQLTTKDIQMIETAYRDAQYESDRHRSWDDPAGQEARSRMRTLKALFGGAPFIDIDTEHRPCPTESASAVAATTAGLPGRRNSAEASRPSTTPSAAGSE